MSRRLTSRAAAAGASITTLILALSVIAAPSSATGQETPSPDSVSGLDAVIRTADGGVAVTPLEQAQADGAQVISVSDPVPAIMADIVDPAAAEPMRSSQWPLDMVEAPAAWTRTTGQGIVVAVIDSGVNGTLPDLAGHTVAGQDFTGDAPVPIPPGTDSDPFGHGTFASTVIAAQIDGLNTAGVAPGVSIMPVRVFDAVGAGSSTSIAAGIEWATAHGADVVNLSLCTLGDDPAVAAAINSARVAGVVVVAATGNFRSSGSPAYPPATYGGVIGVGAVGHERLIADFSTAGPQVDITAPGSYIPAVRRDGTVRWISGTSFSTPHVAAAAALLLSLPGSGRLRVEAALREGVTDAGPAGRDDDFGNGILSLGRALAAFDAQGGTLIDPDPPYIEPTQPPETTAPPPGAESPGGGITRSDARKATGVSATLRRPVTSGSRKVTLISVRVLHGRTPVRSAIVKVYRKTPSGWRLWTSSRTSASSPGSVTLRVTYVPGRVVRVVYPGNSRYKPSSSPARALPR